MGSISEPVPRIMVVEDAPYFQEAVVTGLLEEPYFKDLKFADSGEQALEVFAEFSPDLVLLDFRLPGIDGLETAKRMKEQRPDVKIALVTAYHEEVLNRAALGVNIDVVIPKSEFKLSHVRQLLGTGN